MKLNTAWRFVTKTHPIISAIVFAVLVAALDVVTGTKLRVFPLYYIPVALVAASYSRATGVVAAFIGSAIWAVFRISILLTQ